MTGKILVAILVVLALVALGFFVYTRFVQAPEAPVKSVYDKKIIYDTESGVEQKTLESDCQKRGGRFNPCGSPCQPGDPCIQLCVPVCQL